MQNLLKQHYCITDNIMGTKYWRVTYMLFYSHYTICFDLQYDLCLASSINNIFYYVISTEYVI